ncbi:bifunctional glycosyltransferase family 2/GtrA family protein [Saccharothrix syringae]|uniref:bifunctional glycosyltransferase family 2/GtrA family protein n=1 Tax=Saccharothrix syringae TaxID=103733 RepID=UPI00068F46D8|nr:bifunctional glycosyltransferase family 2/GtrA family protein [Saccharothrix syringae]
MRGQGARATATVEVVIPVHNEERALPGCVAVLHGYLAERLPFDWLITIVDNASTDRTAGVARGLARRWRGVRVLVLDARGKGRAVRTAWARSRADVVVYMDVDLSTGLNALPPMVASLVAGHSDLAIGSRLAPGARTVRGPKRELMSRAYNALLRLTHRTRFRDAQCGFKAARTEVIRPLLARAQDDTWFFDTELLLLAEHNGLRVLEVPVDWVEDVDSRVDVTGTVATNLRGLVRLARAKASGAARIAELPFRPEPRPIHPDAVLSVPGMPYLRNLLSFCLVGSVATLMTLGLFTVFRTWWPPLTANLVAVTLSALFNTGANLRFTLDSRSSRLPRVHVQVLVVFGLYCGFTSGALVALHATVPAPARWVELAVLVGSSAVGTLGRFALLSSWVFRARPETAPVAPLPQEVPA